MAAVASAALSADLACSGAAGLPVKWPWSNVEAAGAVAPSCVASPLLACIDAHGAGHAYAVEVDEVCLETDYGAAGLGPDHFAPSYAPCGDRVLGTPEMPTVGSLGHYDGVCKPCAFASKKGCGSGMDCKFCHLCTEGEKKRRKKEKHAVRRDLHSTCARGGWSGIHVGEGW